MSGLNNAATAGYPGGGGEADSLTKQFNLDHVFWHSVFLIGAYMVLPPAATEVVHDFLIEARDGLWEWLGIIDDVDAEDVLEECSLSNTLAC